MTLYQVIEEMEIVGIIPNYNNTELVVKSNSPDTLNQTSDTTADEKVKYSLLWIFHY